MRLPSNPSKDYYFIHRDTPNNETVIVEYGFVDSPKDDVEQIKNNYKSYAEAVVRAIANYKGIKYTPPLGSDYYIVKKGDTLWNIANKYDISVSEIKSLNNLKSNILQIGQALKITSKKDNNVSSNYIEYKVVKGDNLYTIANKFDVTISDIKKLNNLSTNTLQINQNLKIPGNIKYIKYIVKKGDSLWKIANNYKTTIKMLIAINNLSTSSLKIGQTLLVPSK